MTDFPPRRRFQPNAAPSADTLREALPSPPTRRMGRRKGQPNHFTAFGKAMIEEALWRLGGADFLVQLGREEPAAFASLLGKMLPKELVVDQTLTVLEKVVNRARELERQGVTEALS